MGRGRSGHGSSVRLPAGPRSVGRWVLALVAVLVSACGAKTALESPDAPTDAARLPDAFVRSIECVEVPRERNRVLASFTLTARLRVVDVMFVIDSSASMRDEIEGVRRGLRDRVVPGVRAEIPEALFGVAIFGEFPVFPHARPGSDVGPYELRTPITGDVGRVEVALERTPVWGNLDDPEASVEAIYQVATGEGLEPFIAPSLGCPRGVGGACFRPEAFHVVLLVTDAPMHNGPPGVPPVSRYAFTPAPHTYEQMLEALRRIDAIVIGLGASDAFRPSPMPHLVALARDSGAVDSSGAPLAFDIGGSGDRIGAEVVAALRRLAEGVPLDVDATIEDRPGDAWDARTLVAEVRASAADPPDGVAAVGTSSFEGVRPGTRLTFEIVVDTSGLPPTSERLEIPARLVMRESRRARLGEVDFVIVVPGQDGIGCP